MLGIDNRLLCDRYDVVIVGSGYGGAITAARLGYANHRAGGRLKIAVLERGDEHPTGSFPDRDLDLFTHVRHPELNPLGLYEYLKHPDIDVVQGCGLGGTSLINANVAIVPDADVLQQGWPAVLAREAADGTLKPYLQRAADMLGAGPYARDEDLRKLGVFREVAEAAGGSVDVLDIVVSKCERTTRYGLRRHACTRCGDCVTGCNIGAKNTLDTNYLPMARAFGVDLIPGVEVLSLSKDAAGLYHLSCKRLQRPYGLQFQLQEVTAQVVVLAAGCLGTTGILLRSRERGLQVSPRLGEGFSGNGDFISVAYNTERLTDDLGFGRDDGPRSSVKAGPTITLGAHVTAGGDGVRSRFLVEDVSCPRALVDLLRRGLFALSPLVNSHVMGTPEQALRWARDVVWNDRGAANSSLGLLIMGHDTAQGRIVLEGDQVTVCWPQAPKDEIYRAVNDAMQQGVAHIGGIYLENPRWHYRLLGGALVTVHPLGGCATADSADGGVVDHRGRVFADDGLVHKNLFVADGSVVPRSLGVNPFMTISAFAERAADYLRQDLGLPPFDAAAEQNDL